MKNEIGIYQTDNGLIEVRLEQSTVWLTQAKMVALFGRDQSVVSRHIANVFKEGELDKQSNMQKMHIALSDKPVDVFSRRCHYFGWLSGEVTAGYALSPMGNGQRACCEIILLRVGH